MYKSEQQIIDIRTNLIYEVDCVDHYDGVSLVFTKDKQYIPLEFTKIFVDTPIKTNEENVLDFFNDCRLSDDEFEIFLKKVMKSLND
jgi:hypothetical protein